MKLLRVGNKGNEKPAALDKEGKIRDVSSHISDLNPDHLNFETISKLQSADLASLPEFPLIPALVKKRLCLEVQRQNWARLPSRRALRRPKI